MRLTPAHAACLLLWAAAFLMPVHPEIVPSFTNQWPVVLAWGLVLCTATPAARLPRHSLQPWAVAAAGLVLALLAWQRQPLEAVVLAAATAVFLFGAADRQTRWSEWLLLALLAAGLLSLPLAAAQVWLDPAIRPEWIPVNHKAIGRAAGLIGQPNLYATQLAWALAALMGLSALRGWTGVWPALAALGLGIGIQLSGSRTGLLELALIGLWAWRSRSLSQGTRQLAATAALGWLIGLGLSWLAAHYGQAVFYQDVRAHSHSDASGSRFPIWRDTLTLLRDHWLTGVGWGNFNFAWSFSEMPLRHPAQFDHTHNLPLQLAVELGVPAAVLIHLGLGWVLLKAWRAVRPDEGRSPADALLAQTAFAMLALIGLHSLLEYPLWYTFFLLPSAYWLGVVLRLGLPQAPAAAEPAPEQAARPGSQLLQALGVAIVLGSLYVAWDFIRVLQIYQPFGTARLVPEAQRIANGQRSVLFGALADYAQVLTAEKPEQVMDGFRRPLHQLVDTHLLMAYAQAYAAQGETDKARYIAERIREFRHPSATAFLAVCDQPASQVPSRLPFQCDRTPVHFKYPDFDR